MADLFEFTGIDAIRQRLQDMPLTMLFLAGIALKQEADAILEASQPLVPYETGALRASGHVEDVQIHGTVVQTGVRYGGPGEGFERIPEQYAFYVHERVNVHHPIGQHHFLSQPAFAATAGMLERIAEQLRNAL